MSPPQLDFLFQNIRAVTFDVGGTLLEPMGSVGQVYAEVAAGFGVRADTDRLTSQFAQAWKARDHFDYSPRAWLEIVVRAFDGICERAACESFFPQLYERFARRESWRIFPEVRPVLRSLRQHGFKLGVISNWDERLPGLLEQFDLTSEFSAVVASFAVGITKPSPQVFRSMAERLGLPPHAILHVGDSLVEDFDGASGAGFAALLLCRQAGPRTDGSIRSLVEIIERLGLAPTRRTPKGC